MLFTIGNIGRPVCVCTSACEYVCVFQCVSNNLHWIAVISMQLAMSFFSLAGW